MRVLVTGAGGLVGGALCAAPAPRGVDVRGLPHAQLDIADPAAVRAALAAHRPDALINAAAQAGVDLAEAEPARTFRANAEGPAVLAAACAEAGVRLVHLSTDYVLTGPDRPGHLLREGDPPDPRSTYARAKLAGEGPVLAAGGLVARVQWVHQAGPRGFFGAALRALDEGRPLRLVTDQVGCPTPADLLAAWLLRLAAPGGPTGLWHLATTGEATPMAWIAEAARLRGLAAQLEPTTRAALGGAFRPARSCLDPRRAAAAFDLPLVPWAEALQLSLGASGRAGRGR